MAIKIAKISKIVNVTAIATEGGILLPSITYYGVVFATESISYGVNQGSALSPISDEFTFTTDATKLSADIGWDVPASPNCKALNYTIALTTTSGYYYNKDIWGHVLNYGTLIETNSYNVGAVARTCWLHLHINIPFSAKDYKGANYKLPFGFDTIADDGLIRVFSQGNFTLQDIKDQAVTDGVGDHVYYDGYSVFGIFGSLNWQSGDANSTSTTLNVINHSIFFVHSSGICCLDSNVTLNFGNSTGAKGCNLSNISYSTTYEYYGLAAGSMNFYGCRIDTHKQPSFKNSGVGVVNFFKCLLYFGAGCYVNTTPLIDVTIITNAGYDIPYSTAYRKDVTLVNTYERQRSISYNMELINTKFYNDLSYDLKIQREGTYDANFVDCGFYTANKVLKNDNKPTIYWTTTLGDTYCNLYYTLQINSEVGSTVTMRDKNGNLATLKNIEATGEIGSTASNPFTIDATGIAKYYLLSKVGTKGEYLGVTTNTYLTTWTDYNDFNIIITKKGYETYKSENLTVVEKKDWTISLKPAKVQMDQETL